jgi:hypothetical protein
VSLTILLLQAAQATVADDVSTHPYLTMLVIGGLFSALVAIVKVFLALFERRVNEKFESIDKRFVEADKREEKQEDRLDRIDEDLKSYDKHVALGVKESTEIHAAVSRTEAALASHVEKEEGTTWAKIDGLVDAVNKMQLANELAHSGLVNGQALLGQRVEAVEKKMPNGELEKLATAYHELARRDMSLPRTRKRKASRSVR